MQWRRETAMALHSRPKLVAAVMGDGSSGGGGGGGGGSGGSGARGSGCKRNGGRCTAARQFSYFYR